MTEYTIKDVKTMQAQIDELKGTISNFQAKGCSVPRCPRCGCDMEDLVEDEQEHIHLSCPNCDYIDRKDKLIKHKCGLNWLKKLCEAEGLEVEEQ